MKATPCSLDTVLCQRQQWVVPVYQRHYKWKTGEGEQIQKLWNDLLEEALARLDRKVLIPHYFGAVICTSPQSPVFGAVPLCFLVDGQQRITTFQLVLAAIKEVARDRKIPRMGFAIDAYLINEKSDSMVNPSRERYKLWPSSHDRDLFIDIIEHSRDELLVRHSNFFFKNGRLIDGRAPLLLRAYWYLHGSIVRFVDERTKEHCECETDEIVLNALLEGFLKGFQAVIIELHENDDAQEIFASLNGLGEPLSPFDLIRNYVFHRARKGEEDEEELFDSRWKMFEKPFWSELVRQGRLKRARADHLIGHAVVAETPREVNVGKIDVEYQRYSRKRAYPTVGEELDVLIKHATTYEEMENPKKDSVLGSISDVMNKWDLSTFHPLILRINAQLIDDMDKNRLFTLLESYIVRREIAHLTTRNYNKVVIGMVRQLLTEADAVSAFKNHLLELSSDSSRMPSDQEVVEAVARKKAYGDIPLPRLTYILKKIEIGMRTKFEESAPIGGITIEHIMPQKWAKHWPLPNKKCVENESRYYSASNPNGLSIEDKNFMDAREQSVDTLGNLTIISGALNTSISNGRWESKREKFKHSLLVLNRSIAEREEWNEDAILTRSTELASVINRIWSAT